MRRISIIWKVTIWYTLFLCILAVMVVSVTFLVSGRIIERTAKTELIDLIEELADEIEYEDGVLEADEEIDFLKNGVYLTIYDEENHLLMGTVPDNYDYNQTYSEATIETIVISQTKWYVYETHKSIPGYGMIAVRGLVEASEGLVNQLISTRVLMILSPIIILIAVIGGYIMTKQAFRPVNQMRQTVERISSGKDLTRRVNLGEGTDEIYKLGKTFDQMFERLEDAFEREKQFSSDVSHELRTPVSVILSQCEYALEQQNGTETTEALQSIYRQTKRMSRMIGQLLLLSRSDQGMVKLTMEEVNLSELLDVIVEEEREKAKKKDIVIHSEIMKNIVIQGDETMLVRFFVNLISNAICYGKEGGMVIVVLQRDGQMVHGAVEDNGIGIAAEEQEKIWRRFYQVDSSRQAKEEGNLGLGLSMVQ